MIGKIVSALAGRSVAKTLGGTAAGPTGAVVGAALPVVLPALARRMGPAGMAAAAVGGIVLKRYLDRRSARKAAGGDLIQSVGPNTPTAPVVPPAEPINPNFK